MSDLIQDFFQNYLMLLVDKSLEKEGNISLLLRVELMKKK